LEIEENNEKAQQIIQQVVKKFELNGDLADRNKQYYEAVQLYEKSLAIDSLNQELNQKYQFAITRYQQEDKNYFERAKSQNSLTISRDYIGRFPEGQYVEEVEKMIDHLEYLNEEDEAYNNAVANKSIQ